MFRFTFLFLQETHKEKEVDQQNIGLRKIKYVFHLLPSKRKLIDLSRGQTEPGQNSGLIHRDGKVGGVEMYLKYPPFGYTNIYTKKSIFKKTNL